MNERERKTMVFCMEFIARQINDEDIFMNWLEFGVADGDIDYGQMLKSPEEAVESIDDYYIENDNFSYLMGCFIRRMRGCYRSGGLYCDGICSET